MASFEAFFLDAAVGQRFCIFHTPGAGRQVLGALVYIHPFAEELNRSRRMVALQARAFARAGYAVLQIDLLGCGDSSGDFSDASWTAWLEDVALAQQWLEKRLVCPVWLWGLRAGSLLAVQAAWQAPSQTANLLLWQPVLSGRHLLTQFLRLKFTGDLVRGTLRGGGAEALLKQLLGGEPVEVAGYTLSPRLAEGLEQATLASVHSKSRLVCFEVSNSQEPSLSPGMVAQLARWQGAGTEALGQCVQGASFWQTQEVEVCPELIDASLAAVALSKGQI